MEALNAKTDALTQELKELRERDIAALNGRSDALASEIQQLREKLQNPTAAVQALTHDSGAYFNDASGGCGLPCRQSVRWAVG